MDNWYKLRLAGVSDSIIRKLMRAFDSYEEIFKVHRDQLSKYYKLKDSEIEAIIRSQDINLDEEKENYNRNKIVVLSLKDEKFPYFLKNIATPPVFLYIKGKAEFSRKSIAIVGTRRMTTYGKNVCEKVVGKLASSGVTIVSGLASGIDAIAHEKALDVGGETIAVIGCGLDIIYPSQNREIWKRMEKNGTIISEYPLGTKPIAYNFPVRNRIIAGLSMGVVVIESKEKGGSLITATLALDEGRDVFAVPGDIFSFTSVGCNNLIRDSKAKLVTDGSEILDEYSWRTEEIEESESLELTRSEETVFEALKRESSLDELILETGIEAGELLSVLMELELKGVVSGAPGGRYRRRVLKATP